jgi:hypothetical protein
MLRIEMLPAEYGDCLWVEYGAPGAVRRVLIDGGTYGTYEALKKRLLARPAAERTFELLVVTHIDNDHIDGIVRLFQNPHLGARFNDIWFNGWPQIRNVHDDVLGPAQGEYLAARLETSALPWNCAFCGGPVVVPDQALLPRIDLAGGLRLVLLSPSVEKLVRLRAEWEAIITAAEKDYPAPGATGDWLRRLEGDALYRPDQEIDDTLGEEMPDVATLARKRSAADRSAANGSSIAFLLEYGGARILLGADAHPGVLTSSLGRYLHEEHQGTLELQGLKLAHHGSRANVSGALLEQLACERFLISTNGRRHKHPDPETIARIVAPRQGPELVFNYCNARTGVWDDRDLKQAYRYRTAYPQGQEGKAVEFSG